jgi:D-3-phosphoglycerate dehydrogenase
MKWRILVSAPYMQPVIERFRHIFEKYDAEIILPEVTERLSEDQLLGLVGDIDGVVAGDDHFTAKVLETAGPRLKVLSKWGTGIDSFDLEACKDLGIVVCNTPNAFSDPVADSVYGYILNFARQLPAMDQQMKAGQWDKIPGRALFETALGVIGVGNVGKAVVRRARAFGMRVLGNDIVDIDSAFIRETGVEMVDKKTLLGNADFVTLHCDLNPRSHHLMDAGRFGQMRPTAVFINTARGPIIKEKDLVSALQSETIAGAALDVFEDEPLPESSPLKGMNNVMLAPHNSNSSPAVWEHVHKSTLKNLFGVLEGNK